MFSSNTLTVWDFPDPCTPQTSAENGAFYDETYQLRCDLAKKGRPDRIDIDALISFLVGAVLAIRIFVRGQTNEDAEIVERTR